MFININIVIYCSHFAITHKPWVWKLVGAAHDYYHGASMLAWTYQHVLGHHPYTNIDGADPDIVTAGHVRGEREGEGEGGGEEEVGGEGGGREGGTSTQVKYMYI